MYKEKDLSREFLSVLQEKTKNYPDFDSVKNCPEAYASFLTLFNRLRLAAKNNLKPKTYEEVKKTVQKLSEINIIYENSFNQFRGIAEKERKDKDDSEKKFLTNYELQEFIIVKLNGFFFNVLGEEKRGICNEGKNLIGKLYDEVYDNNDVSWTAIQSFRFDFFHNLDPEREVFKKRPNPFIICLNFYELGVFPQYLKNGEFRIDIPTATLDGKDYFFACCSPQDNFCLTHGHLREQDCKHKRPLENGKLIIHNEDNAQKQSRFYRPGG